MLGIPAATRVRLIVWCKACQHQVEPDPPSKRAIGGEATVVDWHKRLVCFKCGSREIDMFVSRA